jgi:hypothetical protein
MCYIDGRKNKYSMWTNFNKFTRRSNISCIFLKIKLFLPLDDGRMTETCCGNNIRGGEEQLLP